MFIRINTLKGTRRKIVDLLKEQWEVEKIKGIPFGYKVNMDSFNNFPYHLGLIHPQNPSSMLPPLFLKPRKRDLVLDLCAAPGSKTTEIAQIMENKGGIVANDVKEKRIKALMGNIERLGVLNTMVTRYDGKNFPLTDFFDKVLVDAPCSASGREKSWSKPVPHIQKALLRRAFEVVKDGGVVVYSTCSVLDVENERVVDWALRKWDNIKLMKIRFWRGFRKEGYECSPYVLRIPKADGWEGFFIAKFKVSK